MNDPLPSGMFQWTRWSRSRSSWNSLTVFSRLSSRDETESMEVSKDFREFFKGKRPWKYGLDSIWCQFHQHFICIFFIQKCFSKFFSSLQFGFLIFWQKNIGKKATRKMLVKLTTGLNFVNTATESKSMTIFCTLFPWQFDIFTLISPVL